MAGLRALLDFPSGAASSISYSSLSVYNTDINGHNNGGQCCLWTVPAGTTWFAVEMWGGGGGGAGARCCRAGWAGGSGSYSRKIITGLSGGETYTVCAAGTTSCSQSCCKGCIGNPSFVSINGGAVQACASGGAQGCTRCYFQLNCSYSGCQMEQCGSYCGTFGICGVTGSAVGSPMCSGNTFQFMPSAPYTSGGARASKDGCSGRCGGCCSGGYATFPGGGGASAVMHTSTTYCGAAGAGGLVNIFYGTPS